jgi:flavin-dependent thymidylate synthase
MENKVTLIGYYGSDETIALSAWTSTSRDLSEDKRSRIPQLIHQLWNADPVPHASPFEKGIVHFLVDTDIATHIHLLKHRISSINAESARYKELKEDKYYLPQDWNISITSDVSHPYLKHFDNWDEVLQAYTDLGNTLYHLALKDLSPRLGRKRAKESARFFKTYNSQITADVMFNLRSFHNFLTQRMDDHAQKEIQQIAHQMYDIISSLEGNPFEHTLKAWNIKPEISG